MSQEECYYSTTGAYGIKTLAEPNDAVVDIVLVHGLTGGRERTWTDGVSGVLWPEQLLPLDFKQARIITFGYDADIVRLFDKSSSNTVRDHGKSLAMDIAQRRVQTKSNSRPIIFIAHSLGGLVCEQALLISHGAPESYLKQVVECTKAIAFIGTPHAGSDLQKWGTILIKLISIMKRTNNEIVGILNPGSEVLSNLQEEFHLMQESRRREGKTISDLFCFFEELDVPVLGMIVPKHSAILKGYQNRGIRGNHMTMTRFTGRNDNGYQSVKGQLMIWIDEIETEIAERRAIFLRRALKIGTSYQSNPDLQRVGGLIDAQSFKHLIDYTWMLNLSCVDSGNGVVSKELEKLHNRLKIMEAHLAEEFLDSTMQTKLNSLRQEILVVLQDVGSHLAMFDGLSTQTQRAWELSVMGRERIRDLKERLVSQYTMLKAFDKTVISQSQARIEAKLDRYVTEKQNGRREGSVSSQTIDLVSADDKDAWKLLQRELEDVGISPDILAQRRHFILNWFQEAIAVGKLEEQALDIPREESPEDLDQDWVTAASDPMDIEIRTLHMDKSGTSPSILREGVLYLTEEPSHLSNKKSRPNPATEKLYTKNQGAATMALVDASRRGETPKAKDLLKAGVVPTEQNSSGELALQVAASQGHIEMITLLLEEGADVNQKDGNEWSALRWAVGKGHEEIVRFLLENGADIAAKDGDGWTVLHWAARRGHNIFAKLLLDSGADPNVTDDAGFAAIHLAAWNSHLTIVQLLIAMGADLAQKDWWGCTALDLAIRRKHEPVMIELLESVRFTNKASPLLMLEEKTNMVMQFLTQHDILDRHSTFDNSSPQMSNENWKRLVYARAAQTQLADELFANASISGLGMKST